MAIKTSKSTNVPPPSTEEIDQLEGNVRLAELIARRAEARFRQLDAEDKIRELQLKKLKQKTEH